MWSQVSDPVGNAALSTLLTLAVGLPGAFIEFTEATEAKKLGEAHSSAPDPILDAARIYKEVELS